MAVEISALVVVFLALLGGGLGRAAYPFIQEKKDQEEQLRILRLIPPDQLTPEQKLFIENAGKPLEFLKYYKYTAIFGLIGTITVTVSSFALAMNSLPPDTSLTVALALIPVLFLTGYGGGDVSNQLIKSGNPTVKKLGSRIISTVKDVDTK